MTTNQHRRASERTRKPILPAQMFGLFNWGTLKEVFYYRRDAVEAAKRTYEECRPWSGTKDWKGVFEIHRIRVIKR